MNKLLLILISLYLFTLSAYAQNDYATVNIYRPKMFKGSMTKDHIVINGVNVCYLKSGGHLEYKVFSNNNLKIQIYATALGSRGSISEYQLNVQKGHTYNFQIKPKLNRIELENLTSPIKSKKLKAKEFKSLSDVQFESNQIIYNHPKTNWTKESLKKDWSENGAKDIEGIYEKVGTYLGYELAVVKEDNEYKIVYLSGANGTSWNEGDLKAKLNKTAQFGIFKAEWYMLNKSFNNDIIVTFENATMSLIPETGRDKDIYLKTYPTYDEANNSVKSEWKSTGTGFFIDRKGYLVTNYHVVEDGNTFEISVTKNGKTEEYNAEIISVDKQNDLAILKVNDSAFKLISTLNYNFNTQTQDVGSSVFALGYPLTQIMGSEVKFTDGKISSKSGFQGDITTYQISVPIQPGNSGGPLFDEKGNLVGVTSSGVNRQLADNANYAIKTSYLKLLIDSIDEKLELPKSNGMENLSVTEQIKTISEYVVLIKVK